MSEDGFWSRGKIIGGGIIAVAGALGIVFGGARRAIDIVDAPARLTAHEQQALERMAEFERMMEAARLRFCEELGLFPSECPEFTIHEDQ